MRKRKEREDKGDEEGVKERGGKISDVRKERKGREGR